MTYGECVLLPLALENTALPIVEGNVLYLPVHVSVMHTGEINRCREIHVLYLLYSIVYILSQA